METRALARPGSEKPPIGKPTGVKIWMRSRPSGRIGDDKRAVRRDGERRRVDDAAGLGADSDDFPRTCLLLVDAEDRVRAPIEDEVLSGCGLLEAAGLSKAPGDLRGNRSCRLQYVGLRARRAVAGRDDGSDGENSCSHGWHGSRARPSGRARPAGRTTRATVNPSIARFRGWPSGRRTAAAGSPLRDPGSRRPACRARRRA